jgi:hypothetical protein
MDDVGSEPLVAELQLDVDLAKKLVAAAAEGAKQLAAESKQTQAEATMKKETETAQTEQQPTDIDKV